jgi:hypothetical protein
VSAAIVPHDAFAPDAVIPFDFPQHLEQEQYAVAATLIVCALMVAGTADIVGDADELRTTTLVLDLRALSSLSMYSSMISLGRPEMSVASSSFFVSTPLSM